METSDRWMTLGCFTVLMKPRFSAYTSGMLEGAMTDVVRVVALRAKRIPKTKVETSAKLFHKRPFMRYLFS